MGVAERSTDFPPAGYYELHCLELREAPLLRQFTLRMLFYQASHLALESLVGVISTITSPFFCQFVLELSQLPSHFHGPSYTRWDRWKEIDTFLDNQFAGREDFKLIIRTGEVPYQEAFQERTRGTFSSLASRGCVHFETSPSLEKYWRSTGTNGEPGFSYVG